MDLSQLWTEKYRPHTLAQMAGQGYIVQRLEAFIKTGSIPHLLFAGPAGTGKTTASICIARELFGENWRSDFMETNASDERGIDIIRTKIKDFARTRPLSGKFKIIFLDECDALTRDAQQALRRTMESYTEVCRFILSCNYSSKIIEPIQSRCTVFRFAPLPPNTVEKVVKALIEAEGLKIDDKAVKAVVELAEGDLRKSTNLLQSAAAAAGSGKHITADLLYNVAAQAKPDEMKRILDLALKGEFLEARNEVLGLMVDKGLSGEDIVKAFHSLIPGLSLDEKTRAMLLDKVGEYEFRIVEGANDHIQVSALLAQLSYLGKK
jgi:replication factor C small subunit